MEKKEYLSKLKKEFLEEIYATNVSLDSLKDANVTNSVLQAEATLRGVFGDEIYERKAKTDEIVGEKTIIKLNEEDLSFDTQVQDICENLYDAEFDSAVNVLLSKITDQEE